MLKTHSCGELRLEHVGQTVTLAGWVNRRRDMGGIVFIDLRDRNGKTQVAVDQEQAEEAWKTADSSRPEYVLQITGTVRARPDGQANKNLDTGDIEINATDVKILNTAKTPPFVIDREDNVDEMIRLKYRYLDLRRERMQRNLTVRHKAFKFIRDFLDDKDFLEIETPILFKSTPEGARDYLVPSRVHPGKFYALPQSPQQLKQLLMVGGYERYFQMARCFRDEDQRADRQPEFTQLDLEMSFVERDDVLDLIEKLVVGMVKKASIIPLASETVPHISYDEAMDRFGSDRPDLRFGMEIVDIADIAQESSFQVFRDTATNGNHVRGINAKGCGGYSRREQGLVEDFAKEHGIKGLGMIAIHPETGEFKGFLTKFFTVDQLGAIAERMDAEPGDLLLIASDHKFVVRNVLGALRDEFGTRLGLRDSGKLHFAWVINFPLFEEELEDDHYAPSHHMFTSPMPEDIPLLDTDPHAVISAQYDLICNGFEVGGGSIRIHERGLQRKIMELIGFSVEEAEDQFGHVLEAFEYGAPPHGGLALGMDRLCALMCGEPNIREVMAFPKTQNAADAMADAPSFVVQKQMDDLHITLAGDALEVDDDIATATE